MVPEKVGGDAIFVKLGFFEIGAVGQFGIAAVVVLFAFYFLTRLYCRKR